MRLNVEHLNEVINKHTPAILTGIGIIAPVISTMIDIKRDRRYLAHMYEIKYCITGIEYYHIKSLQLTKSNNWLKAHGYPMRRKY